jgi:hypothetical protein
MNEDTLLQIHLTLKELQLTQQQILEKVNDVKTDHKELVERVTGLETKVNYAAGFVIPVIAFVSILIEWARVKVLGA